MFDSCKLLSEYGFGPTVSILVDKIVCSKFSDFNSKASFNKQFVYKERIKSSQREIKMMKCAQWMVKVKWEFIGTVKEYQWLKCIR